VSNAVQHWFGAFCVVALAAGSLAAQSSMPNSPRGPNEISGSPAPCVLPPAQVSPGPNDVNSAVLAVNPTNPSDIIVGSNDGNCGFEGEPTTGFFVSLDRGSTWDQTCMSERSVNGQLYVPVEGPILGYDRKGDAFIGGFYVSNESQSGIALEGFEKSSDGIHWSFPEAAVYRQNYSPATCWMAVDSSGNSPYEGSIYIGCVMITQIGQDDFYQMVVSHSNDGGKSWHLANVGPRQVFPEQDFYDSITVGSDGAIYLAWQYCNQDNDCGNGPVYMLFSKSSDGGNTWSKPTLIAQVNLIYPLPNGQPFSNVANTPAIGVDNSKGPYGGSLYVTMYNWTGTFMQVVVARSTDGGNSWSKLTPVAPGVTHDQFFPWLAVSPTGLVGVMWLDRRNDPANVSFQAFAAISDDGGSSFEPNVQLTQNFSNPNVGGMGNASYNGAAWDGPNYFLAAWMDTSNGLNTQDMIGGIRLK
jgi:hypothetical protein